jgi:membrane dipeptidase
MNRRTFLSNSARVACLLKLAPGGWLAAAASEEDRERYRKALVIDACGGINIDSLALPIPAASTEEAIRSGVTAINWTISRPNFQDTVEQIGFIGALVENDPSHWLMVWRHSDLERAKRESKIGIMMGFQHPQPIEPDAQDPELDSLQTFRRLGVRIMQLTYNNRGLLGDGCLEPGNAGLSKLGRSAVGRMNELGIAVDISHCGQRTTAEAIAASNKPVLVTHAGCSAVHAHPRNKDDRELRALADRGGVIGVYFMPYLVASPTSPTREHVLQHLDHALKVCGTDHVGIGSDGTLDRFPDSPEQRKAFEKDMAERKKLGIAAPEEDRPPFSPDLNRTDRLEIIASGLGKLGYSWEVVEKVLGRNFYRALGEIWGTA